MLHLPPGTVSLSQSCSCLKRARCIRPLLGSRLLLYAQGHELFRLSRLCTSSKGRRGAVAASRTSIAHSVTSSCCSPNYILIISPRLELLSPHQSPQNIDIDLPTTRPRTLAEEIPPAPTSRPHASLTMPPKVKTKIDSRGIKSLCEELGFPAGLHQRDRKSFLNDLTAFRCSFEAQGNQLPDTRPDSPEARRCADAFCSEGDRAESLWPVGGDWPSWPAHRAQ